MKNLFLLTSFVAGVHHTLLLPEKSPFLPEKSSYVFSLKQNTPKGAVFCRMENLSREKLKIWIKIRAGSGD